MNSGARSGSVSVVIPVHNEASNLPTLCGRLLPVLDGLGRPYEVIFVDDGSRDGSLAFLRKEAERRAGRVRVLELSRNFGQHPAILAGFRAASGSVVVTLDADLQNPPEEIPKLLERADAGYDVVGGVRQKRQDSIFRRATSRLVNRITCRITGMKLSDYGCMLRAYSREIIDEINHCEENSTFIPALAMSFARRPVEVPVAHAGRLRGGSKYSFYRLVRLNFDLMTGFSLVPLQMFTLLGLVVSVGGLGLGVYLLIRRFILLRQSEAEGMFTLFAIAFVVMGVLMAGLGIVGEYIGRIYQEVRGRPRFNVRNRYGFEAGAGDARIAGGGAGGGDARLTGGGGGGGASPDRGGTGAWRPHSAASGAGARGETGAGASTSPAGGAGSPPRIVVFAYSDLGHACLELLLARGKKVVAVYTHADAAGENIWFPSVAMLAHDHGVEVHTDADLASAVELQRLHTLAPDLILSFYYRNVLPPEVLGLARLGAFNMHGSLLPAYRGRAPVNWAVLRGETRTGATLHVMERKPDTGDIVDQEPVAIGPDDTAAEVQTRVTAAAVRVLGRQIDALESGRAPRRPQDPSQASTFGRRRPEDGLIDWSLPARSVHDLVRAVTHPYPGAFTDAFGPRTTIWATRLAGAAPGGSRPAQMLCDNGRVHVVCGDERCVEILRGQRTGGPEMDASRLFGLPAAGVPAGPSPMKGST